MEQREPILSARARFVLSQEYMLEQQRSLRPHWLLVLGIVLGVPVVVYCITKVAWRAIFSYVTGAAFLEGVSMWLSVALLLAYIAAFIWILFRPRRAAKRYARRARELFGELPELRMSFFPESMLLQSPASESGMRIDYGIVRKCVETPNLFLLITKEKQVFPVAKTGLCDIDNAGFRALMNLKCPNAKRNWRNEP